MNAIDAVRQALAMSDQWTTPLIEDMRDAPLTQPTPRGGNHPLWVVGHAACSEGGLLSMITGKPSPLERWDALFDMGSTPTTDASAYPSLDEVLEAYRGCRRDTLALLEALSEADLAKPTEHVPAMFAEVEEFKTVGGVLLFIAMHQMSHFGQLADARRAAGRKPLFGMPEPESAAS